MVSSVVLHYSTCFCCCLSSSYDPAVTVFGHAFVCLIICVNVYLSIRVYVYLCICVFVYGKQVEVLYASAIRWVENLKLE